MNNLSKLVLALAVCVPAANAASVPSSPVPPKSCGEPGKILERNFRLKIYAPGGMKTIELAYAGCREEGRNDYLSGYTERDYVGADGWSVALITNHGDGAYPKPDEDKKSEALIYKGKDLASNHGIIPNEELVSGVGFMDRNLALQTAEPTIPACEAKLPKPVYGGSVLWRVTDKKAYYYREDCDICAELDSCDLKTHQIKEEIVAHMVSCSDLDKVSKGESRAWDGCPR